MAFAWDATWKAIALIVALRNRQYRWIGPLLVVNSVGILPMVYLWRFAHPVDEDEQADAADPDSLAREV